jgi:hypothetical protein
VKKNDVVTIGPTLVVILSRRVAMIRGVGEVWVTDTGKFVTCTTDIRGRTSWSLVEALRQLSGHYSSLGVWDWESDAGMFFTGGLVYKKLILGGGNAIQITLEGL